MISSAEPCPICLKKPKTYLAYFRARRDGWLCSKACKLIAGVDMHGLISDMNRNELEPASDGEDV